jgi:putative DNA primase/helicase
VPDSPTTEVSTIREQVEERVKEEAAALEANAKPVEIITPKFVKACLDANELGDGTLFAAMFRGKYVFNKSTQTWLRWAGHHWALDEMDASFAAVEDIASEYLKAAGRLDEEIEKAEEEGKKLTVEILQKLQKSYLQRVKKLRGVGGVKNCLDFAHKNKEPLAITELALDQNPWLLACSNGVVDLRTGKFRPGRPGDYMLKAVPHEWKGIDCPAPTWDRFLNSSLDGPPELSEEERATYREELVAYVRRALGYGITGLCREHMFLVFNGPGGRNGKGVMVETFRYALGPLAGPIPAEMLLDQARAKSSSGPSPDIMELKGMRLAFASETDEGRRFASGQVKWLSGGDTLTGRFPHDKRNTKFVPTHLLILLTNNLPNAPGDDTAFWDRLKLIPFLYRFLTDPDPEKPLQKKRDEGLQEKLMDEVSGILAWLVRGCLEWQKQGMNPPAMVTAATEEYRMGEDYLAQFLEDCCIQSAMSQVKAGDLYKAFAEWYQEHVNGDEKKTPKQKRFGHMLGKQFKKEKVGGVVKYYGLELRDPQGSL